MRKLLAPLAALTALALAAFAACGEGTDETLPPTPTGEATPAATPAQETPAPTQPPDGTGGGGGEVTVVPVTPLPSPSPVPDDWATYADLEGRFTVRYPPTWFREGGIFRSWDPTTLDEPGFPPNSIKVDAGYYEAAGSSGCGYQNIDPQTGEGTPRPGATPATLGGVNGWQGITVFDPPEDGVTHAHGISVIHEGYCFLLAAYFAQGSPDEATFQQIADSFQFTR